MNKTLLAALALTVCVASHAHAADISEPAGFRPYIGVFGDLTFVPSIDATDGFLFDKPGHLNWNVGDGFGVVVGGHLSDNVRLDAELSRDFNGVDNFTYSSGGSALTFAGGGVTQTYALANLWYDFRNGSSFTPYIGGGLGIGWAGGNVIFSGGDGVDASTTSGLAFQVGLGVDYALSDSVSLDLSYRLKGITGLHPDVTPSYDSVDQSTVISHNAQLGLIFHLLEQASVIWSPIANLPLAS